MIRILILFFMLVSACQHIYAQKGWAVLKGEPSATFPTVGMQKVPHHNNNPAQKDGMTWSLNGKMYLYGNRRRTENWQTYYTKTTDMWSYDTLTGDWTWLSGRNHDTTNSKTNIYLLPVFGTKGVADSNNRPGYKEDAITWTLNGKLYMFGGKWFNTTIAPRNDLWMYDPATDYWTWLGGGDGDQHAVFGTKGLSRASNWPGGLIRSNTWVHNGKLYLYGGQGYDSLSSGVLNDIWEYNPLTGYWTWLKGDKQVNSNGSVGAKGVTLSSNIPPNGTCNGWYYDNKFYAFAIKGDDLWEFDHSMQNWTWVKGDTSKPATIYGAKNMSDSNNTPGYVHAKSTWVYSNKLCLYGDEINNTDAIWEFSTATGNWTWVNGDSLQEGRTDWGIYQYADTNTFPKGMAKPHTWQFGKKIYCIFFWHSDAIWEYDNDTKMWKWADGIYYNRWSEPYYKFPFLQHHLNEPQKFGDANCWIINDTMYTYISESYRDAIWRYDVDKNEWAVIHFSTSDSTRYVAKGVADIKNSPGFRGMYGTARIGRKLYMYGGHSFDPSVSNQGYINQLWEFDIDNRLWTMLNGKDTTFMKATGGTKGVGHSDNTPGGIAAPVFWAHDKKLYIYGSDRTNGYENAIWEFDPKTNNWKYIKGDKKPAKDAVYGTIRVADSSNHPGERLRAAHCYYNGKLYLFGGSGYSRKNWFGELNNLWEYDHHTNNWTWIKGPDTIHAPAVFGTRNVSAVTNLPGRRVKAKMVAADGKLYLFGGYGRNDNVDLSGPEYRMNDLWQYDINSNNWTWLDGSMEESTKTIFNVFGKFSRDNFLSPHWFLDDCNVWAYKSRIYVVGGKTIVANIDTAIVRVTSSNAVWCYETCNNLKACYSDTPIIKLDSIITMCNRPVLLNAGNIWCDYLWSNGDITQTTIIDIPGNYWVKVTNPAGISKTDTMQVVAGSATPVNLGNDTLICSSDSLLLNTGVTNARFLWSTGDTGAAIYGKSGSYKVQVAYHNGCYTSDSIVLTTKAAPIVPELRVNSPECTGNNILIIDDAATTRAHGRFYKAGIYTGVDSTRYYIPNVKMSDSGVFYLIDTLNGCLVSDTVYVNIDSVYTPNVTVAVSPKVQVGPYAPLTLTANINYGADSSYLQWYKNGNLLAGETGPDYQAVTKIDINTGDIICVKLETPLNCASPDSASGCAQPIVVDLGIKEIGDSDKIRIYPNPVTNVLNVKLPVNNDKYYTLEVINIMGQTITSSSANTNNTSICLDNVPAGSYILQVKSEDGIYIEKVIISK